MTSRFLTMLRTGALVAVAGFIGSLSLQTAAYAQSSADVQARIRRLERDIRDLQREPRDHRVAGGDPQHAALA